MALLAALKTNYFSDYVKKITDTMTMVAQPTKQEGECPRYSRSRQRQKAGHRADRNRLQGISPFYGL